MPARPFPRSIALACIAATALTTACTTSAPSNRASSAEQLAAGITEYLDSSPLLDAVRSVIVVVDDQTVFEEYYDSSADESRDSFSVTKSVVSTLVGIAVDEGLLDVSQTLRDLLPGHADRMTPAVAGTTLEQLLTMTGGFPDAYIWAEPDWVAAALQSADTPPGEQFTYSDPSAHLVGAVLAEATGRSVLDYAREKLFTPLGIDADDAAEPPAAPEETAAYEAADIAWPVDPRGLNVGGWGLKLRPRDLAAFGRLFLHEGRVDGEQIVSAQWVREATTAQVEVQGAAEEYGYLWWVGEADGSPAFMAVGYGGQLVEVVPDRDLVVVVSTDVVENAQVDHGYTTSLVDGVIAPALDG
jgi:CubicO group peptidase (beta-lactamase class C family)